MLACEWKNFFLNFIKIISFSRAIFEAWKWSFFLGNEENVKKYRNYYDDEFLWCFFNGKIITLEIIALSWKWNKMESEKYLNCRF